ncbi:DUF6243 family protein [Streptomyces sp. BI20]|uniref:DUF6243 family protein n=1 Tax=Streptomyces sp. BI20 TaxID=3403460 RepID=UPI003C739BF4
MPRGHGNLMGVGGARSHLSRRALRAGRAAGSTPPVDPAAQKRELLRRLREERDA